LSRRRTRSRGPARGQTSIPDWVWGAGLGAIVLIFVGGFFLFSNLGGSSGSICDDPLTPIGDSPPATAEGFREADTGLGRLIGFLQAGDLNAANTLFYGPPHNFTHTAEPPIREKDEELGKNLCQAVINFENDFDTTGTTDPQVLANEVIIIRNYLRDGAEVLGFPRPTG
jgi:hypothetical protein